MRRALIGILLGLAALAAVIFGYWLLATYVFSTADDGPSVGYAARVDAVAAGSAG